MENQPTKIDKAVRVSIVIGILLIVISTAYYFVARPILNEKRLNVCLQEGDNKLSKARESSAGNNINKSIADRIIDKNTNPAKYQATTELISRGRVTRQDTLTDALVITLRQL